MAKTSYRSLHLFQLWTLAERFRVPELQDIAFANCKEFFDSKPDTVISSEAVQHAYSHSIPGSTIRQLAVDIWAARASDYRILRSRVDLPSQFIEDLSDVRPGTQKLFASEVYMLLYPVPTHEDCLCMFVANLHYAKAGKDIPDTPFSVPPISNPFEPTPSENLPRRASAAQLANRKIKTLSSRRRKSDQTSRPSPQGPIVAAATPVSRVLAPSTLTPSRSGQRKVRVRLPPSTDPSYTKFSMKSILDELYKIEDNGEKL